MQKRLKILLFALGIVVFAAVAVKGLFAVTGPSEFCVSCHTMKSQYRNWSHSAHRNWAGCSDCHVPQESVAAKLVAKTRDGISHVYAYTIGGVPDPIRLKPRSRKTVMNNCIRCHGQLVEKISLDGRKCWDCHRGTPHGY